MDEPKTESIETEANTTDTTCDKVTGLTHPKVFNSPRVTEAATRLVEETTPLFPQDDETEKLKEQLQKLAVAYKQKCEEVEKQKEAQPQDGRLKAALRTLNDKYQQALSQISGKDNENQILTLSTEKDLLQNELDLAKEHLRTLEKALDKSTQDCAAIKARLEAEANNSDKATNEKNRQQKVYLEKLSTSLFGEQAPTFDENASENFWGAVYEKLGQIKGAHDPQYVRELEAQAAELKELKATQNIQDQAIKQQLDEQQQLLKTTQEKLAATTEAQSHAETELQKSQEQTRRLLKEIQETKEQLANELPEKEAAVARENQRLHEQIGELEKQVALVQAANKKQQQTIAELEEGTTEHVQLEEQYENLKKLWNKLKRKYHHQTDDFQMLQDQHNQLEAQVRDQRNLERELKEVKDELSSTHAKLNQRSEDLETLRAAKERLLEEKKTQKNFHQQFQQELQQAKLLLLKGLNDNRSLENRFAESLREKAKAIQRVPALQSKIEEQGKTIQTLKSQLRSADQNQEELTKKFETTQARVEELEAEIVDLNTQKLSFQQQLVNESQNKSGLEEQLANTQTKLEKLNEEIDLWRAKGPEIENLKKHNEELEAQIQENKSDYEKNLAEITQSHHLEVQLLKENHSEQFANAQSSSQEAFKTIEDLKEQVQTLEKELGGARQKESFQMKEGERNQKSLQQLISQLQEKDAQVQFFQQQAHKKSKDLSHANEQLEGLRKDQERIKIQLQQHQALQKELDQKKRETQEWERRCEAMDQQRRRFQERLQYLENLEKEFQQMQQALSSLQPLLGSKMPQPLSGFAMPQTAPPPEATPRSDLFSEGGESKKQNLFD